MTGLTCITFLKLNTTRKTKISIPVKKDCQNLQTLDEQQTSTSIHISFIKSDLQPEPKNTSQIIPLPQTCNLRKGS